MNRALNITHWVTTALVSLFIGISALTYLFNYDSVSEAFRVQLGFPTWLIYPMAIAKLSAVLLLITKFNSTITEWAYAGLVFNMLLAIGAHIAKGDPQFAAPLVALVLILGSYATWKRKGFLKV